MKNLTTICFIGMDGSGKSTLSSYLCGELKKSGHTVSYTWWLEGENSLVRKLIRSVGRGSTKSTTGAPGARRTNPGMIYKLYSAIVLADYLRFSIFKTVLPKLNHRRRTFIFDRYMYDVIFAISNEFNYPRDRMLRLFDLYASIFPHPDLIFVIDVTPDLAYLRKKEELLTLENATDKYDHYQEYYQILQSLEKSRIVVIDNSRPIETVKAEILKTAMELIG